MTTTTKPSATPRPWHTEPMSKFINIVAENGDRVAVTDFSARGASGVSAANAALIVQAVNSHDQLVSALQQAKIAVEEHCIGQHPDNECWNILRQVEAALAAAGAK